MKVVQIHTSFRLQSKCKVSLDDSRGSKGLSQVIVGIHSMVRAVSTFRRTLRRTVRLSVSEPEQLTLRTCDLHSQFVAIVSAGRNVLNFPQSEHSIDNPSKHDMLTVKEVTFCSGDEKLAAISVWSRVRHRQQARAGMLFGEVLVL